MESIISLSGDWNFELDSEDLGVKDKWYDRKLDNKISLPGSTDEGGYGIRNTVKDPHRLSRVYEYTGAAWYQKEVVIPEELVDKDIILLLERCHWETRVWIDGKAVGMRDSLCTSHRFNVSEYMTPGSHTLTVRVDNSMKYNVGKDAHSVTKETQTNWNGIIGKIQLEAFDKIRLEDIQIYPKLQDKLAKVIVNVQNSTMNTAEVLMSISAKSRNTQSPQEIPEKRIQITASGGISVVELDYEIGDELQLWDEFSPVLYDLEVSLEAQTGKGKYKDNRIVPFGMREFSKEGTQFTINGRKTFLRGTLECCVFPLTGYPPTDLGSWLRIFRVAKAYGLNHIRFHSWCPPEAAFNTADEVGLMLQIETPVWTVLGEDSQIDRYIYEEGDRILKEYGNHPSFCMLAVGNEPSGEKQEQFLTEIIAYWRDRDSRRLYTGTSGWPELEGNDYHVLKNRKSVLRSQDWGDELNGRLNAYPLTTDFDFNEEISGCNVPIVSHEIGQWCVYPNLAETDKYTGVLKPRNIELIKDSLSRKGMLEQAEDFLLASGKWQTLLYKEDIEAAMRTSSFGGFQLLGLTDFPGQGTALVGMLDAFWETKGYIDENEFTQFCCEVVPLLRTNKFTWTKDEVFKGSVEVANYGPRVFEEAAVQWSIDFKEGGKIASGETEAVKLPMGNSGKILDVEVDLQNIKSAAELIVTVKIKNTNYCNHWSLWVYPNNIDLKVPEEITIRQSASEAVKELDQGKKVLLIPTPEQFKSEEVPAGFTSIFWNTEWTSGQKPHTLGILCNPEAPALKNFITDNHTNWQWFDLITNSNFMVLDSLPEEIIPIVQVVDDWNKNRKLGLVFEASVGKGKLLMCSIDLNSDTNKRPVARQMLHSLLKYMESNNFNPKIKIETEDLNSLLV